MYRLLVFILIGSLALPAVPVSGCECSQLETGVSKTCCCGNAADQQKQTHKSCCCQKTEQKQDENSPRQPQCQKQDCDCHQVYSQSATATSVKSVELARQLRDNLELFNLTDEPCNVVRPVLIPSRDLSPPVLAENSGELCAHFCLWQI